MPKDDVAVAISVSTPSGAVEYIISNHVTIEDRAVVRAAMPALTTDDFAAAAQQIREVAKILE